MEKTKVSWGPIQTITRKRFTLINSVKSSNSKKTAAWRLKKWSKEKNNME